MTQFKDQGVTQSFTWERKNIILLLKMTEPTIKSATFNEKPVLFSIEKINNFSQLAVLAH